jgi:hypothetical protein
VVPAGPQLQALDRSGPRTRLERMPEENVRENAR